MYPTYIDNYSVKLIIFAWVIDMKRVVWIITIIIGKNSGLNEYNVYAVCFSFKNKFEDCETEWHHSVLIWKNTIAPVPVRQPGE